MCCSTTYIERMATNTNTNTDEITEETREAVAARAKGPQESAKAVEAVDEAVEGLMNMEMRSSSFDLATVVDMVLKTEVAKWFAQILRVEEGCGDFAEAVRAVEANATRQVMLDAQSLLSTSTGRTHALHDSLMTQAAAQFLSDLELTGWRLLRRHAFGA